MSVAKRLGVHDGKNLMYPYEGFGENEQPAWLDIGALRFEHQEGWHSGLAVGLVLGFALAAILALWL